jgi:hypothetical protein
MSEKPHWRVLFCSAIAESGGNLKIVADQLGVSRTRVSLVAYDKYHGRMDLFAEIVLQHLDGFPCLHDGHRVTASECAAKSVCQAPTSSAREARLWRACQACPNKPAQEVKS